MKSILTLIIVTLSLVMASGQEPQNTFTNATVGLSITKPKEWQFMTADQHMENLGNIRLDDKEMQEAMQKYATAPLVVMMKYPEPYDDVNPSFKVNIRSLGNFSADAPAAILELSTRGMAKMFQDFKIVEPISETKVSGLKAAHVRIHYSLQVPDGRTFPTASDLWIVPRGKFFFMLGAGIRQDEKTGKREEIKKILSSVRIDETKQLADVSQDSGKPFLKQSKKVPGGLEWNREIVSRAGGLIRLRVTSAKPFGVTLVTEKAYKDMVAKVKRPFGKEDVLLTMDCAEPSLEREIRLKAGSYRFIIENQSDETAEVQLECYEVKE